nr:autotransporter-associated beta strand repeat-containing protein [Brucella intermedia]
MSGTNTYTGGTTVQEGRLRVASTRTLAVRQAVSLSMAARSIWPALTRQWLASATPDQCVWAAARRDDACGIQLEHRTWPAR